MRNSVITGSGSYIPETIIKDDHFTEDKGYVFYSQEGKRYDISTAESVNDLGKKTGIRERRYETKLVTSEMVTKVARDILNSSNDCGDIDYIIDAHNFGDLDSLGVKIDLVPSFASRVKHNLGITNPWVVAYDIICSNGSLDKITNPLINKKKNFIANKKGLDLEKIRGIKLCDKESLEEIIVAHTEDTECIAEKVKNNLGIKNGIAYDVVFGCPGYLQGVIQADYLIKTGAAKKILVLAGENLSRTPDPHDRDCPIYADAAGGKKIELLETNKPTGILSCISRSDTLKYHDLLKIGKSYNPDYDLGKHFLKMNGHDLYEYALQFVPETVKKSVENARLELSDIKKVLLHQANEKMDRRILEKFFGLYNIKKADIPKDIMPMTISWLGNSSVATLPVLYDLIVKGKLDHQKLNSGDNIIFASVGAGMNINSMVYRMP